jgi:outer membrane protein assembly factor BamB
MGRDVIVFTFWSVILAVGGLVRAEDWPTFNHDGYRSGVTSDNLEMPLNEAWVFKAPHPPRPAWPGPAKQDYWHHLYNLRPTVTYDRAFHIVGTGNTVYFGSSADDKIYAIDAMTGQQRWAFFTDGPVRFAPAIVGNKLYAGSDDGCVYCLSADTGSLIWKYRVDEKNHIIPGNGRMISMWSIRTGLVVNSGIVYFAAGLFPKQGTYLFALDAEDGTVEWKQKLRISPQGYILASDERLYVPTGRTNPATFSRVDGRFLGDLPSAGGVFTLLTEDVLVTGPGRGPKELTTGDLNTRDKIATFGGLRMLVKSDMAYMQSEDKLSAFNRTLYLALSRDKNKLSQQYNDMSEQLKAMDKGTPKAQQLQEKLIETKTKLTEISQKLKDCYLWVVKCQYPYSMVMTDDVLFVGGENKVAAFNSQNGEETWSTPVKGIAYGLSVINGGLYASTDKGHIYCFRNNNRSDSKVVKTKIETESYPRDKLTDVYANAARYIVNETGINKGYCLVLDYGEGRLAYELARLTKLKIIGIEEDEAKLATAREALDKAGLYGQVVIHQGSLENLSFTNYFANLIVSDEALRTGKLPDSAEKIFRFLRPYGGMIALGQPSKKGKIRELKKWGQKSIPGWNVKKKRKFIWGFTRRAMLEDAGEWTHTYAEPGNTACSGDKLVKGKMVLQWFGQPGPEHMIDRHHRNVPPLFKDGRLFIPGDCIVFAVDAYNGTMLWDIRVPNSRRLGVFLDSGSMAVDDRFLYVVAEDKCYAFDVELGQSRHIYTMPQLIEGQPREWGYIAYSDNILYGSGRRKGAFYTTTSYDTDEALWYRNMKLAVSDYIFAMKKKNRKLLWKYKDGLIPNTTIAMGNGRMYFVETYSPKALANKIGRMTVKMLFDGGDQLLVALDVKTGRIVYKKKLDVSNFEEPIYLNCAKDVLLLSGSRFDGKCVRYYYYAFDAPSGEPLWNTDHDSGLATDGGHGEYNRHPTIIEETIYAWPYAYNLKTGEMVKGWKFDRRGHGCGGVSASAQSLFWRGANPWMYDLGPAGRATKLNTVTRPGCWINIIPAGGLVLIPEASSGCTCGFPLQTSLAFIPSELLK